MGGGPGEAGRRGRPYLGFSAGAMIAPERAIIGGYRVRGVEVCPEEASEGLGEVELREGLGLVPFAVDVHAAQAGTLGASPVFGPWQRCYPRVT